MYFLARLGFETLRGEKNILLVWFLHNLNCINFNLRVIGVSFKDIEGEREETCRFDYLLFYIVRYSCVGGNIDEIHLHRMNHQCLNTASK